MSIRSAIAAALVATAIPLAAPVVAHAAPGNEHDCDVFNTNAGNDSYADTINAVNSHLDVYLQGNSDEENSLEFANFSAALRGVQNYASNTARYLSVPAYKQAAQTLFGASDVLMHATIYKVQLHSQVSPQQLRESASRFQSAADAYQRAIDQACAN